MSDAKSHILVVEGNDITRKLITGILNARGHETYEAADGDAALAFLGKSPALVIIDVDDQSPSMLGLLHKIRKDHGRLPLVAMSEEEDRQALMARIGVAHISVLAKPVVPEALLDNIRACLIPGVEHEIAAEAPAPGGGAGMPDDTLRAQREDFMRRALDLAQRKVDETRCGPFAAVITRGGEVVAEGWDSVRAGKDPTAHAEVMAIRAAARALGTETLEGCEIYTTCEPCPMCLAALYWARIDRLFYAATQEDAARAGFDHDYIQREVCQPEHKRALPSKMMLHDEARIVFADWAKTAGTTG